MQSSAGAGTVADQVGYRYQKGILVLPDEKWSEPQCGQSWKQKTHISKRQSFREACKSEKSTINQVGIARHAR